MGEQSRPVLVFLQTSGAMYAQTLLKRGGGEGTALNTMTPSLLYPTVAHKVSQSVRHQSATHFKCGPSHNGFVLKHV